MIDNFSEGDLGGIHRVVPGVHLGDECHGALVALRRDRVDGLTSQVGLRLEGDQLVDLLVHPGDHDDAQDPHQKQQEGDDEETGKQLEMDGGLEPCHQVNRRAQEPRDQSQITLGRRDVAGPAHLIFFGHVDTSAYRRVFVTNRAPREPDKGRGRAPNRAQPIDLA